MTFEVSSNQVAAKLLVVTASNVPIPASQVLGNRSIKSAHANQ
jgi:hypothetical protein